MKKAISIILILLFCPSTASAVTLTNPDGSMPIRYQTWANQSRVPTVDATIRVWSTLDFGGSCAESLGCAFPDAIQIIPECLTTRDRDNLRACRHTVLHELGHVYDYAMPQWKRDRFQKIIGTKVPWEMGGEDTTPPERFAEIYARCAIGPKEPTLHPVSRRTMLRVCRMIALPN